MQNWHAWGAPLVSTYYFDPLDGDDSRAGTSPATCWKTQAKAEEQTLTAGQSIMKKIDGEWVLFRSYAAADSNAWVYGYYQDWPGTGTTTIPLSDVNWGAYTHISHDHMEPTADGGLDGSANNITQSRAAEVIAAAHANGVKVLLNIADIWTHFFASAAVDHTETFINNIIRTIVDWGYDGVDIDWETGTTSARLHKFMATLYPAIKAQNPNLHVNMAVGAGGSELSFTACLPFTDTLAAMAYGLYLTGGRVTWLNSPLYDGDMWTFWGQKMLSVDYIVRNYLKLGVPRPKLISGLPFYCEVYGGGFDIGTDTHGPLRPRQPYTANFANGYYLGYNKAMIGFPEDANVPSGGYYTPERDHWDDLSRTPYLSIAAENPADNLYLTYDDPASLTAKAEYVLAKQLRGVAIWELSLDWMPERTIKQPLAEALRTSLRPVHETGSTPAAPTGLVFAAVSGTSVTLNWSTQADAFKYRIKRATTSGGTYTTLATQRQAGYTDSTVSSGSTYFYKVQALGWGDVSGPDSAEVSVTASAPGAPTNLVVSPGDLENAAWAIGGDGASVEGDTIHTATSGQTFLNQVIDVAANTDYRATVTLTALSGDLFATLNLAFANEGGFFAEEIDFANASLPEGVPLTVHVNFNSGATYSKVLFDIDTPDFVLGEDIRVDHVSLVASAGSYVPAAPTGLAATTPAPTNTFNKYDVTLTWDWATGADSFNIWRAIGDATNFTLIGNAAEVSFTDSNVGPDATWTYKVTAMHGIVESPRSSSVSVTTPDTYAPPNALRDPENIESDSWRIDGEGAHTLDSRTLALSDTGDTSIGQLPVPCEPDSNYAVTATLTPSEDCWALLQVFDVDFTEALANFGQGMAAGRATNWRLTFDTGAYTNLTLRIEIVGAAGSGSVRFDSLTIAKNLPEIPANLVASPDDLTNAAWQVDRPETTILDAHRFQCGPNTGGGVVQPSVPCKPNTDYVARCQVLREGEFESGLGGFLVFQLFDAPDFNPSRGLAVKGLEPDNPTETYIPFNSGDSTQLVFSITINDDGKGGIFELAKVQLYENAYAHADEDTPPPPPEDANLTSVTVTPTTFTGGNIGNGGVSLSAPAPSGGAVISLTSLTAGVSVPASVTIPQGQSSVNFNVTTQAVTNTVTAKVRAAYAGVTKEATFSIVPGIRVTGLSLSASSVMSGTSVTGTVSLSGPAPVGGQVVNLLSNLAQASVPGSFTIPAGQASGTFTITTTAPSSTSTATITASLAGTTQSSATAQLTITSSTAQATLIYNDQIAPHDADWHGWPYGYNEPRIGEGNVPPSTNGVKWKAAVPWGVGYIDKAGDPSTNCRVNLRNMQLWFLSKATGQWSQLIHTNNIDGDSYYEDFRDDFSKPSDVRTESDGTVSYGHVGKGAWAGFNIHFFPTNRVQFNPNDVGGWLSTFEARLIKDNPTGVDDRNIAKILCQCGADYWQTLTSSMPAGQTYEPAIGGGRFKYVNSNWRTFLMTTCTLQQLQNFPPPIDLSGALP